ncbi:MAG: MFS transporter [Thermoplasmata archaeon]|jgi:MFS family permease|nr:MFS transporter [Thermoplasmata archaeon]MVT13424.1 MFS transporter [Euryarchaeota archaeon]MVT15313.1 MFS transporter [Euryarchaeota archaeon]MVT35621.1 MFS transporter [Euryarchaeota archaeon]
MLDEKSIRRSRLAMYLNQLIGSFGSGLASPFLPYYAAALKFNSMEMGELQASSNLFPNIMQYLWGIISDRMGRRLIFIILGGFVSSFMFILYIFSHSPELLIAVVIVQSIFGAMVVPAWNALVGDLTSLSKRASFIGNLSFYSNLSMLFAGVFFIIYAYIYGQAISVYYIPFYLAGILGVLSSLIMLYAVEDKRKFVPVRKVNFIKTLRNDRDFSYFLFSQAVYNFSMAISWPLFYITTVDVLKASFFQVGLINLIGILFTVLFIPVFGRMIDRYGPRNFMIITRFLFVPVPLVYGISNSIIWIYLLNALTGFTTAITNVAFLAYLLDVAPREDRGKYIGVYNAILGLVTFFGSLIGGALAQFLEIYYPLVLSLLIVYMISFTGRLSGAILFLRIKEKRKYPEHMRFRLNPFR